MTWKSDRVYVMKLFDHFIINELLNDNAPRTPTEAERWWLEKGWIPGSLL